MKNLLLMRHASTADKTPGQTDFDRELTLLGERQAGEAGLWLKAHQLLPELVVCSSATRTTQTAQILLGALELKVPLQLERSMYEDTEEELRQLVQHTDEEIDTLLVIAHNPSISSLASQLMHGHLSLRQASIICLQFQGFNWSGLRPGSCKLHLVFEG